MENFSPLPDFPSYVILEYPGGGAEFALTLPEGARRLCIAAARSFKQGRTRTARDIFTGVLKTAVSPRLAAKLPRYTVTELAFLAAFLLNSGRNAGNILPFSPSSGAVRRAVQRIMEKNVRQPHQVRHSK